MINRKIYLSDWELEEVLMCMFGTETPDPDTPLIKKLKKHYIDERCYDEEDWEAFGIGTVDPTAKTDEDIAQEIESHSNITGKFYCPKCKYRTDEKTTWTCCVICNTSLDRLGPWDKIKEVSKDD